MPRGTPRGILGAGALARKLNEMRNTKESIWQEEGFDRIVRDAGECAEKLIYMINNPAKAGLVDDPWDYPALLVLSMDG